MALMGFYSVWPSFAVMTILLLIADTPLFAAADAPPSFQPRRLKSMDGMRGLLASFVLFHHVAVYHGYLQTGVWQLPPSRFYTMIGPIAVSMFFMVTGYLFWSQLMRSNGKPGWTRLYVGRIFRIGPLYLAAVSLLLACVFAGNRFSLAVPIRVLARQMTRWLALGLFLGGAVNGDPNARDWLAGVTWTIQWEWFFYLSLPLLALVARGLRLHLTFAPFMLTACLCAMPLFPSTNSHPMLPLTALFLTGMTCASLHRRGIRVHPQLQGSIGSLLILALLTATLYASPFTVRFTVLLGSCFFLIVSGCSLFGLLTSRAACRLGDISYGIYLLQGLVLAACFRPSLLRALALQSPLAHWCLALVAGIMLIAFATLAHISIERPGIAVGKRIVRILIPA